MKDTPWIEQGISRKEWKRRRNAELARKNQAIYIPPPKLHPPDESNAFAKTTTVRRGEIMSMIAMAAALGVGSSYGHKRNGFR